MTNIYFDREREILQDYLQSYAEQYPKESAQLHLLEKHQLDPSVNRLLEGFCYLSSEIKRRIDDDLPEVSQKLLASCCPELLQPIPSTTLIEFSSHDFPSQKTIILPKDTLFAGPYHFRLKEEIKINPIAIESTYIKKDKTGKTNIHLEFTVTGKNKISNLDLGSFFIQIYTSSPSDNFIYFLIKTSKKVRVFTKDKDIRAELFSNIKINSTFKSENIFNLIKYFFTSPENYLSIHIDGLEKINWPNGCENFELIFEIDSNSHDKEIENLKISPDIFKLNTYIAINLYDLYAEPIQVTHTKFEYPLIPDINQQDCIYFFKEKSISSITKNNKQKAYYQHQYQINIRECKAEKKKYFIHFLEENDFDTETVSCQITVTNAHLARKNLKEGDINSFHLKSNNLPKLRNINRPTKYHPVPERKNFHLMLLSSILFHINTLSNIVHFKKMLHNLNFSKEIVVYKKIESIKKISHIYFNEISLGILYSGIEIFLEIEEENFQHYSQIFSFGEILNQLLQYFSPINTLLQLTISCSPSERKIKFSSEFGKKSIL